MPDFTPEQVSDHYRHRHALRGGLYGDKPYANYGYWTRPGMTIDEACDALVDLLAEELALGTEDELLECGCGYGAAALHLARTRRPRHITGIDVTDVRIEEGRKLLRARGLADRVTLEVGDATRLHYANGAFSKLLAIECAFHFNTRAAFMAEAFRVLRPGGVMALTDILPAPTLDLAKTPFEEVRRYLSADAKHICDANIYGADTYARLLSEAGFDPVRIYSIKEPVMIPYAEHLERVADQSPPDARERRRAMAATFRELLYVGGDYVVVRAEKPR